MFAVVVADAVVVVVVNVAKMETFKTFVQMKGLGLE